MMQIMTHFHQNGRGNPSMYPSSESEVILHTVIYSFNHIVCIGGISNFQYIAGGIFMVVLHNELLRLATKKIDIRSKELCSLHNQ